MSEKTPEEILRELTGNTTPEEPEKKKDDDGDNGGDEGLDLSALLSGETNAPSETEEHEDYKEKHDLDDILATDNIVGESESDKGNEEDDKSANSDSTEEEKSNVLELDADNTLNKETLKDSGEKDLKNKLESFLVNDEETEEAAIDEKVVNLCRGRFKKPFFSFRNISVGIIGLSLSSVFVLYNIGYNVSYNQNKDKVYKYSSHNLEKNYVALLNEYEKQEKILKNKKQSEENRNVSKRDVADSGKLLKKEHVLASNSSLKEKKEAVIHNPEKTNFNPHFTAEKALKAAVNGKWERFKELKSKLKGYRDYYQALSVIEKGFSPDAFADVIAMLSNPKASDLMIDWLDAWSIRQGDVPLKTEKLMVIVDKLDYPVGLGLVLVKRYEQEEKLDKALYVAKMVQKYNPDERVAKLIRKIENEVN